MTKLLVLGVAALALTACAEQSAADVQASTEAAVEDTVMGAEEIAKEKVISPELRARADTYVAACSGTHDFGAKTTPEQCACFGEAVLTYIDAEGAAEFFDGISPLYAIEDTTRRNNHVDRYFRDLLHGLSGETRPAWNAMFTEAFPACHEDDDD